MKKNLTRIISLVLVMLMVLPVSVFAADPSITVDGKYVGTDYDVMYDGTYLSVFDGGKKTSVKLSVPGADVLGWSVNKEGKDYISVSSDGTVTARSLGNLTSAFATVYATLDGGATVQKLIKIKKYQVVGVEIDETKTKTSFVAGQTIKKSDICVNAIYSDGTIVANISDFDYTPKATPLTPDMGSIKVWYNGKETLDDYVNITVAKVDLEDFVDSIEIEAPKANAEYAVGDILKPADIQIKIKNIGGDYTYANAALNNDINVTIAIGAEARVWSKTAGYTFSKNDVTSSTKKCVVTVSYAGETKTVDLVVKEKSGSGSTTTPGYTAAMTTSPTKKNYVVGDKFNITGAVFAVYNNNVLVGSAYLSDFSIDYTFTATDIGKTTFEFPLLFKHNGSYKTAKVIVTGLSVAAQTTYVDEYATQILDVYLKQEKYPLDYTFSLKDIDYIYGRFVATGLNEALSTRKIVHYEELIKFKAYIDGDIDIEVLDKNGKRKTSLKSHTLHEGDVVNGEATLRFFFGEETYDVDIEVGEPDLSYIYAGTLVSEYSDIEDALDFTKEQDPEIPTTEFDLSKIPAAAAITIKLGRDFKFSTSYEFKPTRNVDIDLNGNTLTLDSDQIEVLRASRNYKVTITNSSEEKATLVYADLDISVVLDEDESVQFEYDKDAPGLVYVTIEEVNNGKVTADYTIEGSKIELGHGNDIKFTFTPNSGYVIDSLKVGTTVVNAKDYTVATNGVVTYTLKAVKEDVTVYVTFKKGSAADDWTNPWNSSVKKNPFKDVSSTDKYYSAVRFVYTNGLFKGTETNKFEPNTTMTRAMFVTVLARLAMERGIRVTTYNSTSFTDIVINEDTAWYAPYVEWAYQNGIVQGHGDGTFGPDEEITHEQMYTIMYRYTLFVENIKVGNLSGVSISSITDRTSISDWALDAVKFAYRNDYVIYPTSTSKKISPQGSAKRSELAMLLERYCVTVLEWENK